MPNRPADAARGGVPLTRAVTRFLGRLADIVGTLARSLSGRY